MHDVYGRVATIAGVMVFLGAMAFIPTLIRRWVTVSRLYGTVPFTLAMDVWVYGLSASRRAVHWTLMATIAVLLIALPLALWLLNNNTACLTCVIALIMLSGTAMCHMATPPAIILLGPSTRDLERTMTSLRHSLSEYRTVAFLRPSETRRLMRCSIHNFYATNEYKWRTMVFHLMDIAPAIVMCKANAPSVLEEFVRLRRRGYFYRTVFTNEQDLDNPKEQQRIRACLRDRLLHLSDQPTRLAMQNRIDRMRRAVPSSLMYPVTIADLVAKAKRLERLAIIEFLDACKRGGAAAYTGGLFERIPSRVSRADEVKYVREDRIFEEIELLLKSAAEVVSRATGKSFNIEYNWANLYNKRGWLARMRGEWKLAENEMRQAIRLYQALTATSSNDDAASALREIGTAYFNLGDVYLAQFHETRNDMYRDRARGCYKLSLRYDERGRGDTSAARDRLSVL